MDGGGPGRGCRPGRRVQGGASPGAGAISTGCPGRTARVRPWCSTPPRTPRKPSPWRGNRGPLHGSPRWPVRLHGLTPHTRYRDVRTGAVHHSAVLTEYGLRLDLPLADWSSTMVHLVRV
ncbi:GH36 C-terminal domain-containing protein [Streptomyces sp. TLI_105]|uniref:GH36 C-terminal domain-containing protein n=1 Tax=Streptomyces sp. TLI_105 TaxID=1881019 RepID=UPI003525D7BD